MGEFIKNLKVSKKMTFTFAVILAFTIILTGIGIFSSITILRNYDYILENPIHRIEYSLNLQNAFTTMRFMKSSFVMEAERPEIIADVLYPRYKEAEATFNEYYDAYKQRTITDDRLPAEEQQRYAQRHDQIGKLFNEFTYDTLAIYNLITAGEVDAAKAMLWESLPKAEELNEIIHSMDTYDETFVDLQDEQAEALSKLLILIQIIALIACVILSVLIIRYMSGIITKPISLISNFFNQAGTSGDVKITKEEDFLMQTYSKQKDELGTLIANTGKFVTHIVHIAEELEDVAHGDLTIRLEKMSDKDTLGISITEVVDSLNKMFHEINDSTQQVSIGASQVADGASALSSGSTQQAATLEEISASISDIADRTKENAQRTKEASKLAETIMQNAEKGNAQMKQMINAVDEINHANQSISKVIKAIDDIAFQTNILALNAAVEAARAGAAGKGFAVVAEEVRNLAAKSAESAKDTGSLIANSMDKAKLGTQIASETAASLGEIVEGISESNHIIADIANSSEEQTMAISQINVAVSGVTQVVQQNSATAEQSAAASEEMSGQASVLESLISRFKLK